MSRNPTLTANGSYDGRANASRSEARGRLLADIYNEDGILTETKTEIFDEVGNLTGKTYEKSFMPSSSRSTETDMVGCEQTAAMQRACAHLGCFFGIGGPVLAPDVGPGPASMPESEPQALPAACNSVALGRIWGDCSSSRGGAYDLPPWLTSGGPVIFEGFIPEIDGVIIPPRH